MFKRSQLISETFVYALTVVIVGAILVMGYKYIGSSKKVIDRGELLQLQNRLVSDTGLIGNDHGRFKKISYALPRNLEEVCFVDLNKKDEVLSSKLISFYPLIKDSINSGLNKNIFFVGNGELHSLSIKNIQINHYPYMSCLQSKNSKIEVGIEGLGGGNSLILADFVTKAKISKDSRTILKSADGIITLEVPKETQANTNEISIEMIELSDSTNRASDVYKFGPSGTKFSNPIELRIKYNPAIVGECPSKLNFYHFNDDGTQKAITPSKSIDCKNKIAVFEIDSFSYGYISTAGIIAPSCAYASGNSCSANAPHHDNTKCDGITSYCININDAGWKYYTAATIPACDSVKQCQVAKYPTSYGWKDARCYNSQWKFENELPAGACGVGCTNECSSGQTRCVGNYTQTCGNYDADACLEWPSSMSGNGNEYCDYGCSQGICLPKNQTNVTIQGDYTGFFDFPKKFFDESIVSKEQMVKVTDAQYLSLKDMHNGIAPYTFAKIEYNPPVYGATIPSGLALGDSAFPGLNSGHPRWEVMAHEQGHNFFGGTSAFYGKLAFPYPFLQESLAVLSAFYTYHNILENKQAFGIESKTIDSLNFDFTNGRNGQKNQYNLYVSQGKKFSVNDVLTSQALDYKMIVYGETYGWKNYKRVSKAFENGISNQFIFQDDGITATEQSTYIIAALSVAFNQDFRQDFTDLNFPLDESLYNKIHPKIKVYVDGSTPKPGTPTYYKGPVAVNSVTCGDTYTFDVTHYSGTNIWINQIKNGITTYDGILKVPTSPYTSICNKDEGSYTTKVYTLTSTNTRGDLIGSTNFTITAKQITASVSKVPVSLANGKSIDCFSYSDAANERIDLLTKIADRSMGTKKPLEEEVSGLMEKGDRCIITNKYLFWLDGTGKSGLMGGVWPLHIDGSGSLNFKNIENAYNWAPNELLMGSDASAKSRMESYDSLQILAVREGSQDPNTFVVSVSGGSMSYDGKLQSNGDLLFQWVGYLKNQITQNYDFHDNDDSNGIQMRMRYVLTYRFRKDSDSWRTELSLTPEDNNINDGISKVSISTLVVSNGIHFLDSSLPPLIYNYGNSERKRYVFDETYGAGVVGSLKIPNSWHYISQPNKLPSTVPRNTFNSISESSDFSRTDTRILTYHFPDEAAFALPERVDHIWDKNNNVLAFDLDYFNNEKQVWQGGNTFMTAWETSSLPGTLLYLSSE